MNIFYELQDWLLCYKKTGDRFIKMNINKTLEKYITDGFDPKQINYFFLDENKFSFFCFDIDIDANEIFTISDLKRLVEQKKNMISYDFNKSGEILYHLVDDISVDGERTEYFLGKKGKIKFRLKFVTLNEEVCNIFKVYTGNLFYQDNNLKIYPQSYFTMNYIRKNLNKTDFNILYIYNTFAKLVMIKDGFYKDVIDINLGIDKLKDIFKENDIYELYDKTFDAGDFNDFTFKLINNSFSFYDKMLCGWINNNIGMTKDLFIVSKLSKNRYLIDNFSQIHRDTINGYLMPLVPENIFKTSKLGNFDISVFVNEYMKKTM